MITKASPLYKKRVTLPSLGVSNISKAVIGLLDTLVSGLLILLAAIFFKWLEGKQREFDVLEDTLKD